MIYFFVLDNVRKVRYNRSMTPTLEINATEARKNIYKLIEQVSRGEVRVVIHNTDTDKKVMLTPVDSEDENKQIERDLKIVAETAGSLKGGKYYPDEFERARKVFVKEYMKKYEK